MIEVFKMLRGKYDTPEEEVILILSHAKVQVQVKRGLDKTHLVL